MSDERDRLERLAAFLPAFEAGFDFGTWQGGTAGADGVIQMPWFDFSPAALEFLRAVNGAGWVTPFDWRTWLATPEGRALTRDPKVIATASVEDLGRVLTALVRGNRFYDGALAGAYESGVLLAVVRRARVLADETPAEPGTG